jgi:hypothetical protein
VDLVEASSGFDALLEPGKLVLPLTGSRMALLHTGASTYGWTNLSITVYGPYGSTVEYDVLFDSGDYSPFNDEVGVGECDEREGGGA